MVKLFMLLFSFPSKARLIFSLVDQINLSSKKCKEIVNLSDSFENFSYKQLSNVKWKIIEIVGLIKQKEGSFCRWCRLGISTNADWASQHFPPGALIYSKHKLYKTLPKIQISFNVATFFSWRIFLSIFPFERKQK